MNILDCISNKYLRFLIYLINFVETGLCVLKLHRLMQVLNVV